MLKLIVDQESAADPVMPVRWCLPKDDLDEIIQKTTNPHLLLVVTDDCEMEVQRLVVPLGAMLEYVHFERPGKYRIQATVVWMDGDIVGHFMNRYSRGNYRVTVTQFNGKLQENLGCERFSAAELNVSISKEFFAQEPAGWEATWVNLFFNSSPVDQCAFRKRRILAYTIQPPLVLLFVAFKSIFTALLAFFGLVLQVPWEAKDILEEYWGNLFHPFRYKVGDLMDEINDSRSVFSIKDPSKDTELVSRSPLIAMFRPLFVTGFGVASLLLGEVLRVAFWELGYQTGNSARLLWWKELSWFEAMLVGAGVLVPVLIVGAVILIFWRVSFNKKIAEWRKQAKQARMRAVRDELSVLACDLAGAARLKELPTGHRTVHLRFENLKAKVCRPFAR